MSALYPGALLSPWVGDVMFTNAHVVRLKLNNVDQPMIKACMPIALTPGVHYGVSTYGLTLPVGPVGPVLLN